MFLNRVFRQEWFNRFPWFLASLITNGRTLRKCYLFSCRYKNVWDIGIRLKPHFYKKCQAFRNPNTDFSRTSANRPQSSPVLYDNKCNTYTFVKGDARIEGNCLRASVWSKNKGEPPLPWIRHCISSFFTANIRVWRIYHKDTNASQTSYAERRFLRMSCRKIYTTCFPVKRDLNAISKLTKETTKQVTKEMLSTSGRTAYLYQSSTFL